MSPLMYIYSPELAKEITNLHACKKSHQLNISRAQILLKNTHPIHMNPTSCIGLHQIIDCLPYIQAIAMRRGYRRETKAVDS